MGISYLLEKKSEELARKEFLKLSKDEMLEEFLDYDIKQYAKKAYLKLIIFALLLGLLAMFVELLRCSQ